MKITMTLLMFLVLSVPNTYPEDYYNQLNLPEGAVARLGKGRLRQVQYSPDGTRLAVQSSIGIWLYDTTTYREIVLLTGQRNWITGISFSPDGKTLASASWDDMVARLWDVKTGELKGYTHRTYETGQERIVQPGWRHPCQCG